MERLKAPRIVCLGEGMVEERVGPDGTLQCHYGGDTLNTAIHLARAGCDVAYATAVGVDAESKALVAAWAGEGIDTTLTLHHPARGMGRYRITVDARGERSFSYDRATSAARELFALAGDDWRARVSACDVLFFSLISLAILPEAGRTILIELARVVRARGGLVVFDGNYRPALWPDVATAQHWQAKAIETSTIGLPTLDDEIALGLAHQADAVAARWTALGCAQVLVKDGAAGCRLPDGTRQVPPEVLAPIDTSGAGDAFDAGYLAALLAGREESAAALEGHRLAGWTIMRPGAIPPRDLACH